MSDDTSFPELTADENAEIRKARDSGFASYFPAFPDAETQAKRTLEFAREWNRAAWRAEQTVE